jgi:hypothetical protein
MNNFLKMAEIPPIVQPVTAISGPTTMFPSAMEPNGEIFTIFIGKPC